MTLFVTDSFFNLFFCVFVFNLSILPKPPEGKKQQKYLDQVSNR